MTKKFTSISLTLMILGAVAVLAGCKGDLAATDAAANSETNLQKTRCIYSLFSARKGYRGPKSEEEMQDFLQNDPSIEKNLGLLSIGRDDYDKITISDRDGEPFVIRFGLKLPPMTPPKPLILETVGVEGMRQVILSDGKIAEYDAETCEKMIAGKWKSEEKIDRSEPQTGK